MKKFLEKHRTFEKLEHDYKMQSFISKIVFFSRVIRVSEGNVLFYGDSLALQFIFFLATFLCKGRSIHVTSDMKTAKMITMLQDVSTIFVQETFCGDGDEKDFKSYARCNENVAGVFMVHPHDVRQEDIEPFELIEGLSIREHYGRDYGALLDSKLSKIDYMAYKTLLLDRVSYGTSISCLHTSKEGVDYEYSYKNMMAMVQAIDMEFDKLEQHVISVKYTKFEESFAWILYFFLRGDKIDFWELLFSDATPIGDPKLLPKKVLISEEVFEQHYHSKLKYMLFSWGKRYIVRFRIIKWLFYFIANRDVRGYYKLISKTDELVFLTQGDPAYITNKFFTRLKTRVSIVFGTHADGYTIGINRFDDKECTNLSKRTNTFRRLGVHKLGVDTLFRLHIGGDRVHSSMKKVHPVFNKDKKVKFRNLNIYAEVDDTFVKVLSHQKDMYFGEGGIPTVFGPAVKAIKILPFVKECIILKHNNTEHTRPFVAVVKLDEAYIDSEFEESVSNMTAIQLILNDTRLALNERYSDSEQIHSIVISRKFFNIVDYFKKYTTVEDFVRLLDQQPFNLEDDY